MVGVVGPCCEHWSRHDAACQPGDARAKPLATAMRRDPPEADGPRILPTRVAVHELIQLAIRGRHLNHYGSVPIGRRSSTSKRLFPADHEAETHRTDGVSER